MIFNVDERVLDLGLKIKAVVMEDIDNESKNEEYEIWRKEKIEELIKKYKDYSITRKSRCSKKKKFTCKWKFN